MFKKQLKIMKEIDDNDDDKTKKKIPKKNCKVTKIVRFFN